MADRAAPHPYTALARATVERYLSREPVPGSGLEIDPRKDLWRDARACFVSIKTLSGDLRGCIGTILPVRPSLDAEIIENAISSSTRDPRFPPMRLGEVRGVTFSVDVLSRPEEVRDRASLDPAKWGVIVSKGMRRGVLLPDLDGIDTVGDQLEIAARKAGISSLDGVRIERFSVDRYAE
ncbi:MAG: AmmeMemoRadiSam system protein A [Synergistaceae bacterium]|nr:AmmeMemoRadiSam system protein A [Synergistaceae bacterium]